MHAGGDQQGDEGQAAQPLQDPVRADVLPQAEVGDAEEQHALHVAAIIQEMGAEDQTCKNIVYLGTFPTCFQRQ